MDDSFATRIRSVKLKSGGEIRLLQSAVNEDRAEVERRIRRILDAHTGDCHIAGFAFVIWDAEGSSSCDLQCWGKGSIPSMLAPDFVRNRLLGHRIETWTLEALGR